MGRRFTIICGLALAWGTSAGAQAKDKWDLNRLSCTGVLSLDDGAYQLQAEPGAAPWCDASIEGALIQRVLKSCTVGQRCHIEGAVVGHGAFSRLRIRTVARPDNR